jgi:hypothetical protein
MQWQMDARMQWQRNAKTKECNNKGMQWHINAMANTRIAKRIAMAKQNSHGNLVHPP